MESFIGAIARTNVDLLYDGLSRIPNEGEELYAKNFMMALGGGPVATLIHLHRLEVPVRIHTFIGQDLFSRFAADALRETGVPNIVNEYSGNGIPVNVSSALITPRNRTFVSYSSLSNGKLHEADDADCERVYRNLRGAKFAAMQPGWLALYRALKADGTRLLFDIGWEDDLSFEKYADYYALTDYATPSEDEAALLTGERDPYRALQRLRDRFETPIVKLSDAGCLFYENGTTRLVEQIPQTRVVDATGAGDAFLAGLLYGLVNERPLADAILYGNILGGNAVTELGCLTARMNRETLERTASENRDRIKEWRSD